MTARRRYAENTTVSVENSQAELTRLLRRHGAHQIVSATDDKRGAALVAFAIEGRQVRLEIEVPTAELFAAEANARSVAEQPRGWRSMAPAKRREWAKRQAQQAERQRWRALVLVTKAKLELVADGLSTIQREFLADLVLPDGSTVGKARIEANLMRNMRRRRDSHLRRWREVQFARAIQQACETRQPVETELPSSGVRVVVEAH